MAIKMMFPAMMIRLCQLALKLLSWIKSFSGSFLSSLFSAFCRTNNHSVSNFHMSDKSGFSRADIHRPWGFGHISTSRRARKREEENYPATIKRFPFLIAVEAIFEINHSIHSAIFSIQLRATIIVELDYLSEAMDLFELSTAHPIANYQDLLFNATSTVARETVGVSESLGEENGEP